MYIYVYIFFLGNAKITILDLSLCNVAILFYEDVVNVKTSSISQAHTKVNTFLFKKLTLYVEETIFQLEYKPSVSEEPHVVVSIDAMQVDGGDDGESDITKGDL
jgi:hypothetical protein